MAETSDDRSNGPRDDSGFFAPYSEFAKSLRTWFIAYGIGAPAFALSNATVSSKVLASGCAKWMAGLFLSGVALQILQALLYKSAMWQLYSAELDRSKRDRRAYRIAEFISDSFVLELAFDLGTLGLLSAASMALFRVLLA